jgi:hypothetical protein
MQALAVKPDYKVRSFALAVPSLNDIFIRVAGGMNHLNGNTKESEQGKRNEPAQSIPNR